jgi:hypothetical protein
MPTIRNFTTLGIGGTNANVLAGSQFEFLGAPSRVQVYASQDSGGGAGIAEVEVFFGQELELSQTRVNVRAAADIRVPDDLVLDDIGAAGDRLVVRVTETGGAAVADVLTQVKITPIGR